MTVAAQEVKNISSLISEMNKVLHKTVQQTKYAQMVHWNYEGPNFQSIHDLFKTIYDEHFEAEDRIAERIRIIGGRPVIIQNSVISMTGETSETLLVDALTMQRNLSSFCAATANIAKANYADTVTEGLLIDRVAAHDKFAWMIQSHIS